MGVKPIGAAAMTNRERQQRFRDKVKNQTLEESEKEERRMMERCCDMVYQLEGTTSLFVVHALLRNITYQNRETPEQKRKRIINMCAHVDALIDYEIELAERDGSLSEVGGEGQDNGPETEIL
jgi:hypothetical protein